MILGIDHVALSCAGLRDLLPAVRSAGFHVKFTHFDLPNHESKKPFLASHRPLHAVAYCQSQAGIALELTDHGPNLEPSPNGYQVLFDGAPEMGEKPAWLPATTAEVWKAALGCAARAGKWAPFRADFWYLGKKEKAPAVLAVLAPVTDLTRSLAFWTEGLRAVENRRGEHERRPWVRLSWRSPVARWSCEIVLWETKKQTRSLLDDAGFPCLAFLTNDLTADRERLVRLGAAEASVPSDHVVDGKALKIAFLRGPGGELIELIEVAK